MDSMKASLRLMRSSRSISYWDLGATGMFDGMLIDERGAVLRREKPARGRMGCRDAPLRVGGARACRRGAVSWAGANSQAVFCACKVRKCAVFEAAAKYMAARCYRFDLARIDAVCEDLRLSKTELLSGAKREPLAYQV